MRVFVKNMRGQALMPCSQRKARLLLKQKKAKIVGYKPFTIQLCYATGEAKQEVTVGIDEGARHIGVAIVSQDKVLVKGEIELRDAPCFEEYLNRNPKRTKPQNLKTMIYLPIA